MPELWVPYGSVETLVTIQAENLGSVCDGPGAPSALDVERVKDLARGAAQLFICDCTPATMEVVRALVGVVEENQALRILSPAPRKIEGEVPELKGKVLTLPPPLSAPGGEEPVYSPELTSEGTKVFIGAAKPDPYFGIVDAKVGAALNWVSGARSAAADASPEMEPNPFQKTEGYDALAGMMERVPDARFLTVVPQSGKPKEAMEDPPFDAIKNAFPKVEMSQGRGLVVGAGGRGYDDTFASALRGVWGAMSAVRKTGSVLLMAECSEGIGSPALEMLVTGQISKPDDRRRKYVEGLEEVFYLNKLKEDYDVLLLSGLPETYARSKLGLATAKGSGEAVGRILNRVGRSGKLNVVPRAPECAVASG